MIDLVETAFTEEDRKYLRTLAKEVPKLVVVIEELPETIDVLGDKELLKSIRASKRDVRERRLLRFGELLKELVDEKEI